MQDHRLKVPRRQRVNQLDLILFWHETPASFRCEFKNDYILFERYVWREAKRLIESA